MINMYLSIYFFCLFVLSFVFEFPHTLDPNDWIQCWMSIIIIINDFVRRYFVFWASASLLSVVLIFSAPKKKKKKENNHNDNSIINYNGWWMPEVDGLKPGNDARLNCSMYLIIIHCHFIGRWKSSFNQFVKTNINKSTFDGLRLQALDESKWILLLIELKLHSVPNSNFREVTI